MNSANTALKGQDGALPRRGQPLSSDIQARIGRKLIEAYDSVLQQPVPDRFLQLLNQLDAKVEKLPTDTATLDPSKKETSRE